MQSALFADRIKRWASTALTTFDGKAVYGATSFRDVLVDLLGSTGASQNAAKARVRDAFKRVPWALRSLEISFSSFAVTCPCKPRLER